MNDRFNFRIWNKQKNKYLDGIFAVARSGRLIIDLDILQDYDNPSDLIIEQCTGLKDNCGNLIYEGDIIGDGEDDYVIKWDSNRTMFVAEDIDTSYEIEDVLDTTICVIGNIHEQVEQKDVK